MEEYNRVKKIQRYSCIVACLNRFSAQNIEIILLSIHLVIIILCLMNIFIIPWNILNKSLFTLRIVILVFLAISIICVCFNLICRKTQKLKFKLYFIALYASFVSVILIILDFLFILISLIIVNLKIKAYTIKKYDYKSILAIDIFCLLILIPIFFLWYAEILNVFAKINAKDTLKDYIDNKIKFYISQNAKIVNIELNRQSNNFNYSEEINGKNFDSEDVISNKIEMNEKENGKRNVISSQNNLN